MKANGKTGCKSDNLWQSQNYLHNTALVKSLLGKTNIRPDDTVLEIGPGKGIITRQLARRCKKVYGIEYDYGLYKKLKEEYGASENVDIIYCDFMKYELPREMRYKVFSNIPFNITAEVVNRLLFCPEPPDDIYLVMQREAALKYAGNPYAGECMRSLLIKPFFRTGILHYFGRTDFFPVPSVNTVLFRVQKRGRPLVNPARRREYTDFIAHAFSMHGISIGERLAGIFTVRQLERLSKAGGFDPAGSILELELRQWLIIFDYYLIGVSAGRRSIPAGAFARLLRQQERLAKIHRNRM